MALGGAVQRGFAFSEFLFSDRFWTLAGRGALLRRAAKKPRRKGVFDLIEGVSSSAEALVGQGTLRLRRRRSVPSPMLSFST